MWKVKLTQSVRGRYRVYSPSSVTSAYMMVKEGKCSIRKAAKQYGLPESTVRNRLSGKVDPETTRSGPATFFTQEQEARLANHLKFMSSVGYGYSRAEVIDLAADYAVSLECRDRDHPLSLKWYHNFMSRWPELKVIKPRGLQIQRAKATSVESVQTYFTELGNILNKYALADKPERIYNVDEKGLSTMHKPPKVVTAVGTKPQSVTSGSRQNITVLGCGNASGQQVPPYFIFPGERMRQELLEGHTPGADGTVTTSGWSNSEVFKSYLDNHLKKFLPERSPSSPILLLYDGHKSHVSIDLIDWAKQENIILFVLPAHTSHVLQPMDIGCFGPFETIYNAMAHKYMRDNCGESITRNNICGIACKAYTKALSPNNVQVSFRRSGIFPFNPNVVDKSQFLPSTVLEQETESDLPLATVEPEEQSQDYFQSKEKKVSKKKPPTKKRRYLSHIISGKAITEESMIQKINDHNTQVSKKPKQDKNMINKSMKNPKITVQKSQNSPQPGPSTINISDSFSSDDESIADEDKCCMCLLYTPEEVRKSVSLVFTKWAQCDHCDHWVHLIYCCDTRVVRRGDIFLCPHCKEE